MHSSFYLFIYIQSHPEYTEKRYSAFVCDITTDPLSSRLGETSVDIALMIFVLSAVSPANMVPALKNVFQVNIIDISCYKCPKLNTKAFKYSVKNSVKISAQPKMFCFPSNFMDMQHKYIPSFVLVCLELEVYESVCLCVWGSVCLVQVLKPGGSLLFRDYGLYDHAMLRFGRGHKISEHFYVRQDGTRAYYFSEGDEK